ncbi:hypothetical protein [Mesorhizobium sp.]|uniref:hypothetical protein n=1 Tax=Mesorhizobium sp. TaxID=1871066 RepID=UPI00257989A3|nr:hypothetical protein [Mesorhizobium sp.]
MLDKAAKRLQEIPFGLTKMTVAAPMHLDHAIQGRGSGRGHLLRMTAAGIAWIKQPIVVRDTSFIELRVAPAFRH